MRFGISAWLLAGMSVLAPEAAAQVVVGSVAVPDDVWSAVSVNPNTDRVFISTRPPRMGLPPLAIVDAIDPTAPVRLTTPEAANIGAFGGAVNPATNFFFGGSGALVTRFDGTTLANTGSTGETGCGAHVAVDVSRNLVYVGAGCVFGGSATLKVVDGATLAVVSPPQLNLPFGVPTVHVNAVTRKAYLAANPQIAVQTAIYAPPPEFALVTTLEGLVFAVNPTSNVVYAYLPDQLRVYDGTTDALVTTIPGLFALGGAVDPARNRLYVASAEGYIREIDGVTHAPLHRIDLPDNAVPNGLMAVDSVKGRLYALGRTASGVRLYVVDLRAGQRCTVVVDRAAYANGDTIRLSQFQLRNAAPAPAPVEFKLWLDGPAGPIRLVNAGAAGDVVLPAELVHDFGLVPLFPVTAAWPRGDYEVGCRLLHPITGRMLSESLADFTVQ